MNSNAIETSIGILKGRDAIFVDNFRHVYNTIEITGEINGGLCSRRPNKAEWYKYFLKFINVKVFKCENIDYYQWDKWNTVSSFDVISNSEWIEEYGFDNEIFQQYILETYDNVYFIICESYSFDVIGER